MLFRSVVAERGTALAERLLRDDPAVVVWTLTRVELLSVVDTHAIRAADALQIGAALVAAGDDPAELEFVTFDQPQAAAAEREGFRVRGAS